MGKNKQVSNKINIEYKFILLVYKIYLIADPNLNFINLIFIIVLKIVWAAKLKLKKCYLQTHVLVGLLCSMMVKMYRINWRILAMILSVLIF